MHAIQGAVVGLLVEWQERVADPGIQLVLAEAGDHPWLVRACQAAVEMHRDVRLDWTKGLCVKPGAKVIQSGNVGSVLRKCEIVTIVVEGDVEQLDKQIVL